MNKVKKFKKGDTVLVVKGKDRGKKGVIMQVLTTSHRVIVEGVNILKKHVKPNKKNLQGGIIDITHPIQVANIRLICPETEKPSRVGFKITRGGKKERIAKVSGASLDVTK
jgi:large subunit ribosomal protein L24